MGSQKGNGGGGGLAAATEESRLARERAEQDRMRWEDERRQVALDREIGNQAAQKEMQVKTQDELAKQQRSMSENAAQQNALAQSGGLAGAKAASTAVSAPDALKVQNSGIFSLGPLSSLMKKRALSQSNVTGSGNSLDVSSAQLGGS